MIDETADSKENQLYTVALTMTAYMFRKSPSHEVRAVQRPKARTEKKTYDRGAQTLHCIVLPEMSGGSHKVRSCKEQVQVDLASTAADFHFF